MTLKHAALLATIGTVLATILLVFDLVNNFLAFIRALIPLSVLLSSLIYTFAAVCVSIFLYTFYRAQS